MKLLCLTERVACIDCKDKYGMVSRLFTEGIDADAEDEDAWREGRMVAR